MIVSRLVSYKQVSLIVQVFNKIQKPLLVIGTSLDIAEIILISKSNIQLLGWQTDKVIKKYIISAKGFAYSACEDFRMALVEAQDFGTPVIAYGAGGALETVKDARLARPSIATGIFY